MADGCLLLYHDRTVISESILQGEKVRLRPMEEHDLPKFVEWLADPEVTQWLAQLATPPSLEEEYDWYDRRRSDPESLMWAIETPDGRLVGSTELRLEPARRKAEFGIVIGDKDQWSSGLGTDAVRLITGYAFGELDLNRVELTTAEENARAIRCYEKVGFVREGLKRQDRVIDGRFANTVVMSLLREEWAQ
jgi:RimJ/RimL family protein N-acetyltransferase